MDSQKELDDIFRPDDWEPEGASPTWLWVLAILCWLLAVYTMYQVEHRVYGGVVRTNTLSFALIPLGAIFAWFTGDGERKERKSGKWAWLAAGIVLAAAVVCVVRFWERNTMVTLCQMGFGCLVGLLPKRFQRTGSPLGIFVVYALLAVGTLIAPRIAGYVPVAEAAQTLHAQGYTAATFQQAPHGRMIADGLPGSDFTPEEWKTPVYLFSAEKDGVKWAAVVSPTRGTVVGETPAPEGSGIELWLRER